MQSIDIKGFQEALTASHSVLILLPENPSFDAVAAALALQLSLRASEKEVTVLCPSQMIVEFNRLVGVDKVTDKLGDKNLRIRFKDYRADDIEKVSYDIKDGEFTLLVVSKPKVAPPNKEQVELSYSGASADLVLVVGATDRRSLGKFSQNNEIFAEDKNVGIINHVPVQGFTSALELINPQGSSNSEVVFQLIEALGLPVDEDIAKNLLAGLRAGTDNFQTGVTAETFAIASRLMRSGALVAENRISNIKSPGGNIPFRKRHQAKKEDATTASSVRFREPTLK